MVTFYRYPKEHWRHLRTTKVVELPFAALRLRTDAAKRFKKVERATAVSAKLRLTGERVAAVSVTIMGLILMFKGARVLLRIHGLYP